MVQNKLAFLGPLGTFSHQAAQTYLQKVASTQEWKLISFPTIAQVLYAINDGSVEMGLVPAENSIEGTVNITLDMLAHELSLFIQGEIILDIKHHLLTQEKDLTSIHSVLSHPQALAQCRHFLQEKLQHAQIVTTNSTSEAVQLSLKEKGSAAIASFDSHLTYGIPILSSDIGDYPLNQTRFFLIGSLQPQPLKEAKTSLVLAPEKDSPGSLYDILGEFAQRRINLTKIESRPAKKELGNYLFFIECERGLGDPALQEVLTAIREKSIQLKLLGSYSTLI
jgi:prephenate dehydratase